MTGSIAYHTVRHESVPRRFILGSKKSTRLGGTVGKIFISLFLHDGSQTGDLELTMQEGLNYLKISMIGFAFFQ